MAEGNGWTPTQARIMEVLGDGKPHARDELVACLEDEMSEWRNVAPHLTAVRKKLRPSRDVICQVVNRAFMYRLVGLVNRRG
jgi:hypothetical protein